MSYKRLDAKLNCDRGVKPDIDQVVKENLGDPRGIFHVSVGTVPVGYPSAKSSGHLFD